jgi:hypothetical protein
MYDYTIYVSTRADGRDLHHDVWLIVQPGARAYLLATVWRSASSDAREHARHLRNVVQRARDDNGAWRVTGALIR